MYALLKSNREVTQTETGNVWYSPCVICDVVLWVAKVFLLGDVMCEKCFLLVTYV